MYGPGPVGRRSRIAGALVAGALALAGALSPEGMAAGGLTQLPGADGCVREGGAAGCGVAHDIGQARWLALSPDDRNLYVLTDYSLTTFDRNPTSGVIAQKAGAPGCFSRIAGPSCTAGPITPNAFTRAIAVTPGSAPTTPPRPRQP
jgi:hypothetical protein